MVIIPTNLPSTYPFRTQLTRRFVKVTGLGQHNHDATTKGPILIGHDVWIGERATIMSGCEIGTGSIIGAGAVVARNIPPYSIAVGNPARVNKPPATKSTSTRYWRPLVGPA